MTSFPINIQSMNACQAVGIAQIQFQPVTAAWGKLMMTDDDNKPSVLNITFGINSLIVTENKMGHGAKLY